MKLLLTLSLALFVALGDGAGVTVHTEVANRALEFFDSDALGPGQVRRILYQHQDAFQVGLAIVLQTKDSTFEPLSVNTSSLQNSNRSDSLQTN